MKCFGFLFGYLFMLFINIMGEETDSDLFTLMEDNVNENKIVEKSVITEVMFHLGSENKVGIYFDDFEYEKYYGAPKVYFEAKLNIKHNIFNISSQWKLITYLSQNIENKVNVEAYDNYLGLDFKLLSLKTGFITYHWGKADEINPVDNLNSIDFIKTITTKKIPQYSSDLTWYVNNKINFDLVFIPFTSWHILPNNIETFLEQKFTGIVVNSEKKTFGKDNYVLGLRLSGYFNIADLSLYYSFDKDRFYTPDITFKDTMYGYVPEKIELTHKRLHRFGFDFRTILNKTSLWGEICFSLTEDHDNSNYKIRNSYLHWIVGADYKFDKSSDGYFNIQYDMKTTFGYDNKFYNKYPMAVPIPDMSSKKQKSYYYYSIVYPLADIYEKYIHGFTGKLEYSFLNGKIKPNLTIRYILPTLYQEKTPNSQMKFDKIRTQYIFLNRHMQIAS